MGSWHTCGNRFPDFGKEVRREFEVYPLCYDCKKFYKGCKGQKRKVGGKWNCSKVKWCKVIDAG